MFTFLIFNGLRNWSLEIPLPYTVCISSDSSMFMLVISSFGSPYILYQAIHFLMVALHWWTFASMTGVSTNIFSFIIWSATSIVGFSSANSNVCVNYVAIPSQFRVPCRNSIDAYQVLGVISNVCMKWWTHSCHGYSANIMQQWWRCLTRFSNPK